MRARNLLVRTAVGGVVLVAVSSLAAVYAIAAATPERAATGARATGTPTTRAGTAAELRRAPRFRYIYNSGSAPGAVASYGWNLIDVGSRSAADDLDGGARGLVWVGDYDNDTCSWQVSDVAVRAQVRAAVGDAHVFGWFFSDEPNPYTCPSAPAQHRARSALIHGIDPATATVIVLDSNGFRGRATRDALDQLPLWRGASDYVGLDPYPCYRASPCDFSWIDKTIDAANAAGLDYWGVVQAFEDSNWRWPSAAELSHMLGQWAASRQTGYMTFAWTWDGKDLSSKRALLQVLRSFNATAIRARCVVPRVTGYLLVRARALLRRNDCVTGTVSTRYAPRHRGRVVAQKPSPGATPPDRRVDLVVGRGRRLSTG